MHKYQPVDLIRYGGESPKTTYWDDDKSLMHHHHHNVGFLDDLLAFVEQEVLWRADWVLFCLAWCVYSAPHPSLTTGHHCLSVWHIYCGYQCAKVGICIESTSRACENDSIIHIYMAMLLLSPYFSARRHVMTTWTSLCVHCVTECVTTGVWAQCAHWLEHLTCLTMEPLCSLQFSCLCGVSGVFWCTLINDCCTKRLRV